MKEILKLKKVADGLYKECDTGIEYTRTDVCEKTYNWLLRENKKLRERKSKKEETIKELKHQSKELNERNKRKIYRAQAGSGYSSQRWSVY